MTASPGKVAHVSPASFGSELFSKALEAGKQLDLCAWSSRPTMFRIFGTVNEGRTIHASERTVIGFYMKGGRPVDAPQFQEKNSRCGIYRFAGLCPHNEDLLRR